jgi:hypothetical protein
MRLFDVSPATQPDLAGSDLPKSVLYSISARLGGSGLDTDAYETVRGLHEAGILGRAIVYANRQRLVPASRVQSLRWHPVRLLSLMDRAHYYGAKKHYLDAMARAELRSGRYDLFHAWSGECVRTLREAKRLGIPSIIEIPTWHRNKGRAKPAVTKSERERLAAPWPQSMLNSLLVTRQQAIEEYDLATRRIPFAPPASRRRSFSTCRAAWISSGLHRQISRRRNSAPSSSARSRSGRASTRCWRHGMG